MNPNPAENPPGDDVLLETMTSDEVLRVSPGTTGRLKRHSA